MGDPLQHARSSAEKFGGEASDYLEIHQILDSSKLFLADWRHRSVLHNTFGIHLMENWIIGPTFERESDGVEVCTRTVVSQHIVEDLNMVPTLGEFLREMPLRRWMMRATPTEVSRVKTNTVGDESQDINVIDYITTDPKAAVTASIVWRPGTDEPTSKGWYMVDHVSAKKHGAHGCPALYFLEGKWYIDTEDMIEQPAPEWWAGIPVDPILDDPSDMAQTEPQEQMSKNAT